MINFALQHDRSSWGSLPSSIWKRNISLRATACGLCWSFQQLWMQWWPSFPSLWIHQIQRWSWHRGRLSLHRQRWNLQIFSWKRRCTSPRLSQHYSGKASLMDSSLNIYILSSVMRIQTTTGCWRWTEACGWVGATSKHSVPGYTLVPALRWRSLHR